MKDTGLGSVDKLKNVIKAQNDATKANQTDLENSQSDLKKSSEEKATLVAKITSLEATNAVLKAGVVFNINNLIFDQALSDRIDELSSFYAASVAKADGLPIGAALITDVEAQEQNGISKSMNNANNQAFINEVAKYGYRSAVYTMSSWLGSKMDVDHGWIASYPYNATGKNWYSAHHSWQWGSTYQFRESYGSFDVSQNYDNFFYGNQTPLENTKSTINNVVSVKGDSYKAYTTYNNSGQANIGTNVISGTSWKSAGISVINDKPFYIIGVDTLIPQSSSTFNGTVVVNYRSDYGVLAYNSEGNSIGGSNKVFKGGTIWKTTDKLVKLPNVGYAYKVATNEYIPVKYAQGSGFK